METAIQSAKTVDTVVVGEDTDLLILLLYHADMDGNELYFRPELKQNAKSIRVWNIETSKESLDRVFIPNCCLSMQLLVATLLLGCMGSASLLHFLKSNAVMNLLQLVTFLCRKMPRRMISSMLEKMHLSFSTTEIQRMV